MSNYRNGAAFEHRCKRELEAAGYFVVRSAGSHGEVDLLAIPRVSLIRAGRVASILVQAKRGAMSPAERQALAVLAEDVDARPVVARYRARRPTLWVELTPAGDFGGEWQP